jgi:hypothetical protein
MCIFKKIYFGGKDHFRVRNSGIVTIRRIFGTCVPTLALHGINGVSTGN